MPQLNRLKRPPFDSWPLRIELLFPHGLFGFEAYTRYKLTGDQKKAPFLRLESLENSSLLFYVIDPFPHCPSYEPALTRVDLKDVGVIHEANLILLTIVDANRRYPTMNLSAPLLIHLSKKIGKQLLTHHDAQYPLDHPKNGSSRW